MIPAQSTQLECVPWHVGWFVGLLGLVVVGLLGLVVVGLLGLVVVGLLGLVWGLPALLVNASANASARVGECVGNEGGERVRGVGVGAVSAGFWAVFFSDAGFE